MTALGGLLTALAVSLALLPGADAQGGQQQWPNWVPGEVKELMKELDDSYADAPGAKNGEKDLHTAEACRIRKDILKHMSMVAEAQKGQLVAMVLNELGWCDLVKNDHVSAVKRFESAINELNVPNEDMLMNDVGSAPFLLMKQASKALRDNKIGEAGVALRRTRHVSLRLWDKVLKQIMKQNKIPKEGLSQVMPQLMKEKVVITTLGLKVAVDKELEKLDLLLVKQKASKDRKNRLSGVAGGTLEYLPGLPMEAMAKAERLPWLGELANTASEFAKEAEDAQLSKHATVMKRTKAGSECEKLPKICKALQGASDVATNGFGESRLLLLKADKQQKLDMCESNANIGALLALTGDVKFSLNGDKQTLKQGEAIGFDLCLEGSVTSAKEAQVLFIQAWHPEVAALERTSYIREKSASWKLDEAQVKAVTKAVNDAAKKPWDQAVKAWREGSTLATELAEGIKAEQDKKRENEKAEEEAKAKEADDADEDKKKALEDLEKARIAKQEAKNAKLQAKREKQDAANKQLLENEPWRLDPKVVDLKEKLLAAQEERRDANNKMEFDESTRLTKEVSKLERKLESAMEKGMKYYKKHGKVKDAKGAKAEKADKKEEEAKPEAKAKEEKVEQPKASLEELEKQMKKAAGNEDFAEASRLKKEIAALKAGSKSGGAKDELKLQLEKLEKQKKEAAAKEDFTEASRLKKEIAAVKAKMEL